MNLINKVEKLSLLFNSLAIKYDNSFENFILNVNDESVEDFFVKSLFIQLSSDQNSLKYIFLFITILKLAKKYKSDKLALLKSIFNLKDQVQLANLFEKFNADLIKHNNIFTAEEIKALSVKLLKDIIDDKHIFVLEDNIENIKSYQYYSLQLSDNDKNINFKGIGFLDDCAADYLNELNETEFFIHQDISNIILLSLKTIKEEVKNRFKCDNKVIIVDRMCKEDYNSILSVLSLNPIAVDMINSGFINSITEYIYFEFVLEYNNSACLIKSDNITTVVIDKVNPLLNAKRKKVLKELISKYNFIYYSILLGKETSNEYTYKEVVRNMKNCGFVDSIFDEFIVEFEKFLFYKFNSIKNEIGYEEVENIRNTIVFDHMLVMKCFELVEVINNN
jgi:hypothetical protein